MLKRVIAGAVGLPILAVFVILGGVWLQVALAAIVLVGMWEFYRAFGSIRPVHFLGFAFAILHIIHLGNAYFPMGMVLIFLPVLAMIFVVARHKVMNIEDCTVTTFGFIYVALTLGSIYLLRHEGGAFEVWLIFIAAWGCDTGAYFTGKTLGKRKLAPVLSPNKTVEGSVGGTMFATLLGVVYALVLYRMGATVQNHMLLYAAITFVCSIFAQLGDLAASAIKRHKNIKDFGNIIPGHGGVLDRFDSIIFAAPAALAILTIWGGGA
ncbi:MAG: phosphatidate cytidylyltransferase [Defluviitaleaceae bacterium]|nr:phosphatidate cytidylyltransferase [Defluviitaleaceae bacterium]